MVFINQCVFKFIYCFCINWCDFIHLENMGRNIVHEAYQLLSYQLLQFLFIKYFLENDLKFLFESFLFCKYIYLKSL